MTGHLNAAYELMNTLEIILVLSVAAVVAVDIALRVVIAPHRKDKLVEELLDSLHEPCPEGAFVIEPKLTLFPSDGLRHALLKHFMQSALSCQVVEVLAGCGSGMNETEIARAVNARQTERDKRTMPEVAFRRVIMILMGADFVVLRRGVLSLTDLGRRLHKVLEGYRRAAHEPVMATS